MSERTEKTCVLFESGCTCSQAGVVAYCDLFSLNKKTAMRIACGLGAGVGRLREMCGAVSGMAVLAGLKYGSDTLKGEAFLPDGAVAGPVRGPCGCRSRLGLAVDHEASENEGKGAKIV